MKIIVLIIGLTACAGYQLQEPLEHKLISIEAKKDEVVPLIGVMGGFESILTGLILYSKIDNPPKSGKIYIIINSLGGSIKYLEDIEVIIANIKLKGTEVNCIVGESAASAAFMLLFSCDHRYAMPNSKLLFHPPAIIVPAMVPIRSYDAKHAYEDLHQLDIQTRNRLLTILDEDIVDKFFPLNIWWEAQHFVYMTKDPNWIQLINKFEVK